MRAPTKTFLRAKQLRRELTLPEIILWQRLRRGGVDGIRFRRQHPVGPYILDFYCAAHRLAVEVDGSSHDFAERAEHDRRRKVWLENYGIRVLRFPAREVLAEETLANVLNTIAAVATRDGT